MCCIVFVCMFSGMRDSEVQSLKRGCVEPFWGHLTLTGKEFKTFRGAQARWVVIEPVARAARLAEAPSWDDDRIVVSARPGSDPVIDPWLEIDSLIATMNVAADLGLLEHIPEGAPIRPHRFGRTFAITASRYPWMQIALNWQLTRCRVRLIGTTQCGCGCKIVAESLRSLESGDSLGRGPVEASSLTTVLTDAVLLAAFGSSASQRSGYLSVVKSTPYSKSGWAVSSDVSGTSTVRDLTGLLSPILASCCLF